MDHEPSERRPGAGGRSNTPPQETTPVRYPAFSPRPAPQTEAQWSSARGGAACLPVGSDAREPLEARGGPFLRGVEGARETPPARNHPEDETPGKTPVRVVAHRVDALIVAFRVDVHEQLVEELAAHRAIADELGRAEWKRGEHSWQLAKSRSVGRVYLENLDARLLFDTEAPGAGDGLPGWTLQVTLRATTLAQIGLRAAIALTYAIAHNFAGGAEFVHEARVRRFDLAADFEGWQLNARDVRGFVKPGRARVASYFPELEPAPNVRAYGRARDVVTGFTVSAGNPLMCRIYDKTEELRDDALKRAVEEEAWKAGGWQGGHVTRVEFQLRGEVLDELCRPQGGLRDPRALERLVGRVWRYCTTRWLRLVLPGSATRLTRAKLDPRWRALQRVRFSGFQAVAVRVRQRAGATLAMALGTVISFTAGRSAERVKDAHDPETGEVLDPDRAVEELPDDAIRAGLSGAIVELSRAFGAEVSWELEQSPRASYRRLLHRVHATRARFSTVLAAAG